MNKMISIKGRKISEDTIVEALKKHCDFNADLPDIEGIELVANKKAIVSYLQNNLTVSGNKVSIIKYKSQILLVVPLPDCNTTWTYKAFDYVKNFCEANDNDPYPIHDDYVPDAANLYIKLGSS